LVMCPTNALPHRMHARGQRRNGRVQARLMLVVETNNEQSKSFFFEQLDVPVVAPENQSTASGVAQDMRAKAGEAISKVTDAAAGRQPSERHRRFARV
jgi:hypothetical protein